MGKIMSIAPVDGVCAVCEKPWNRGEMIQQLQSGGGHPACSRARINVQAQYFWVVDPGLAAQRDSSWTPSTYRARVQVSDMGPGNPSTCVVKVLDGWAMGQEFVTSIKLL